MNTSRMQIIILVLYVFNTHKDTKEDHIPSNNFQLLVGLKKQKNVTLLTIQHIFEIFEFQIIITISYNN